MATVNLLNYSWDDSTDSNVDLEIDTSPSEANTQVKFTIGSNDGTGYSKAYIEVDDISKYSSIYFNYKRISQYGITSLWFGIFDSYSQSSKSGSILFGDNSATYGWSKNDASAGGAATLNIPSTLTGRKYIGFRFYGNGNEGKCKESIYINSLTATTRGYTLTYNANGGSGGPSAVSNITSTTISSTKPTRSGYDFLGWSKSSSATSASYVAGNSISLSSNTTLYAVWRKFYTVTYNANGGSDAPSSDKKIKEENLTLNSSSPTPMEDSSETYTVTFNANGGTCDQYMTTISHVVNYKFTNWNTKSDGSGTSYQPGGLYTNDSDITLYAQYTSTTTYNSVALPTPFRDNYDFLGWSTNEYDTSGITGEYTPTEDTTLYAIWKIKGQVYICDKLGGYSPYKVLIRDGSGWNQYVPYIYTYSGWEIYSG